MTATRLTCLAQSEASSLAVRREGKRLYLTTSNARFLLRNGYRWPTVAGPASLRLPGDVTVALDTGSPSVLRITHGSQETRVALNDATKAWFQNDALWSGHAQANTLRGILNHEGLSASMMNMVAVGDNVLGVVTWRSVSGSGNAIKAQQLVRLRVLPAPQVEPLRLLDLPAQSEWIYGLSDFPCQRLIKAGKRLLLYTQVGDPTSSSPEPPAELDEIDENGKTLRIYARLVANHYPLSVLRDRWLLILIPDVSKIHALGVYDFQTKRERPLPGNWKGVGFADYICAPPEGNTLLVSSAVGPPYRSYIVSLPTGRRIAIHNPSGTVEQYLWHGMAILVNSPEGHASVYSTATGRLLRRLPLPQEQKAQER